MNYELINETIGLMDFDLIEAADEAPQSAGAARVTPFVKRPWLKWAAAAVAIVVIAGGTPLALKAIDSFRNENFVAPNGGGNSGIVAPVDSNGSDSSEPESSGEPESENDASSEQSGESRSRGSEAPGGSSTERPDDPASSSGTPSGKETSEQTEGDFVKDNMPAATYKINGENRSFVYQKSSVVKIDGEAGYRVIDHYADADGATISVNADSGGLIRYEADIKPQSFVAVRLINEDKAKAIAERVLLTTDVPFDSMENADVSVEYSDKKYFVIIAATETRIEVCISRTGKLLFLNIE